MKNVKTVTKLLAAVGISLMVLSCATKSDVYEEIDLAVGSSSYVNALAAIEKGQEAKKPIYPGDNQILLYLDKGVLEHYAEQYQASAADLQEAERLIEEAFTKSITAEIGSYFANDNTKEYAGEDFEDVYTNVFGALNYYNQGDVEGALVEIRKVNIKLQVLADKYIPKENSTIKPELVTAFVTQAVGVACMAAGLPGFIVPLPDAILAPDPVAFQFTDSALAQYLAMIFYRGDNRPDDARISREAISAIYAASPNVYSGSLPASIAEEAAIPAGKARLNFIGFTGLSPVKEQKIEDMDLLFFPTIGTTLRPLDNERLRLTVGNLAVPTLVERPSVVTGVTVDVNGEKVQLDLLEDISKVVEETFAVKYPAIRAKAYIRALLKYITVEVAAQVATNQGLPDMMVVAAATAAKKGVDASEQADIRAGRYLPGKAYVGGITLDPGSYDVTFTFSNGDTVVKTINAAANKTNLVEAFNLK
ncbi:MAG: hypothetical protein LBL28_08465 [Treponema sp.]|jgi:hypothetical protein|nr:hypothetical protein [Treponema sp.]